MVAALLGYADAILAGRRGARAEADSAFAAADAEMGSLVAWYRHYARRVAAEAALADGWGDPVGWLVKPPPTSPRAAMTGWPPLAGGCCAGPGPGAAAPAGDGQLPGQLAAWA